MSNSTWKVTNNTTEKKLVVINASVDSDAPKAFYYDQKTTLLSFSTDNLLSPGNADSVTIPDVQKDKSGYSLPFTLIIAEAETLAPVTAVTCKADLSDLKDITVDDSTVKNIAIVFDFFKNIIAFPGSQLAMDFAALDLTNATAVKTFFEKSGDYASVTLDALTLVQSYYNALPYGWANGKNTTIYLYSGDFENNTDTDKVRYVGAISITNDWTSPLPLTVPDQFKIELKLNEDQPRQLVFSNGIFWDSAKTTTARLSLVGSFTVPSQLSLDDNNNSICTFLVGSINGKPAFGLEGVKPANDHNNDGSFLALFDVENFRDGLTLGMYGVGIAVSIFLLVKVGQFVKWCKDYGKPTIDQKQRAAQTEELRQHITDNARAIVGEVNAKISAAEFNAEIIIPEQEDLIVNQEAYAAQQIASKTKQSVRNVQKMVDAQRAQLETIAGRISNDDAQAAADRLEAVQERLNRGTSFEALKKFREELPDIMDTLSINGTNIFMVKSKINRQMSNEERAAFDEAYSAYDKIYREQARVTDEIKDIQAGFDEREVVDEPVIES